MLGLSNQQSKPQRFYNAFKLLKCNKVNAPNSHICKSTRSSSMKSVYTWQLSPPCYDLWKYEHSSQNVEVCGLLLFCELWMNSIYIHFLRWSWCGGHRASAWPWWTETWTPCSWRLLLDRSSPSTSCRSSPSPPRAKGWASSSGCGARI